MATTYDFIAQNKRRTLLLVLLFPIIFCALAYVTLLGAYYISQPYNEYDVKIDGYEEVFSFSSPFMQKVNHVAVRVLPGLWCATLLWVLISYYCGAPLLLAGVGAIKITRQEQPEIYRLVENLCLTAGLPVPNIYIINDNSLNAFATGRDPEHASIALTKGIIQKLERVELEGVVAHELCHIQNRDIRLMLVTVAGISFFTFLAEMCFRVVIDSSRRRNSRNKNSAALMLFLALGIFFAVYGYLIAPLIRLALSRTREYQADATAALLTRNPEALARALEKISIDPRVESLDSHASMAAMCIANPLDRFNLFASLTGLMSTHPPTEKRIAVLREMSRGY